MVQYSSYLLVCCVFVFLLCCNCILSFFFYKQTNDQTTKHPFNGLFSRTTWISLQ